LIHQIYFFRTDKLTEHHINPLSTIYYKVQYTLSSASWFKVIDLAWAFLVYARL